MEDILWHSHNDTETGSRAVLALWPLTPRTVRRQVAVKQSAKLSELCGPQMVFSLGADQALGRGTKHSYLVGPGFMLSVMWTLTGASFHLHYSRYVY